MTTPQGMQDKGACETPMRDHVERFWKYLETETVRILVDMRRDTSSVPYWDSSSFSDAVAKALVADRRQAAAPQGREANSALTKIAAECHRAKWQFDMSGDYKPKASVARGLVAKAFDDLHKIGDMALKLRDALTPAVAPDGAGEWRCFHCEEIFTDRATAAEHFGISELETPGCKLNAIEGGLLGIVRRQEDQLQQYHREDTASYREFYSLGADHSQALRREEEKGYARGLADGRALARAQEPGKDEKPIQSSGGGVESRHAAEDAVGPEFAALHPSEQSGHAAMGKRDGVLSDLAGVAPGPPEAPPPQVGSGREEIARPGLPEALRAISQRMRSIDGDRDHMNTSRLTCADTQAAFKLMDMAADALRPERSGGRGA